MPLITALYFLEIQFWCNYPPECNYPGANETIRACRANIAAMTDKELAKLRVLQAKYLRKIEARWAEAGGKAKIPPKRKGGPASPKKKAP